MTQSIARGGRGKGHGKGIEVLRTAMQETSRNSPGETRRKEWELDAREAIRRAQHGEFKTAQRCVCHHSAKWAGSFMHLSRGVLSKECKKCRCNHAIPYAELGKRAGQ